jgi:hypothetical protein
MTTRLWTLNAPRPHWLSIPSTLGWIPEGNSFIAVILNDSGFLEAVLADVITVWLLEILQCQWTFEIYRSPSNNNIIVGNIIVVSIGLSSVGSSRSNSAAFCEPCACVGRRWPILAMLRNMNCTLEGCIVGVFVPE